MHKKNNVDIAKACGITPNICLCSCNVLHNVESWMFFFLIPMHFDVILSITGSDRLLKVKLSLSAKQISGIFKFSIDLTPVTFIYPVKKQVYTNLNTCIIRKLPQSFDFDLLFFI